jgi:hypothetical protein
LQSARRTQERVAVAAPTGRAPKLLMTAAAYARSFLVTLL